MCDIIQYVYASKHIGVYFTHQDKRQLKVILPSGHRRRVSALNNAVAVAYYIKIIY